MRKVVNFMLCFAVLCFSVKCVETIEVKAQVISTDNVEDDESTSKEVNLLSKRPPSLKSSSLVETYGTSIPDTDDVHNLSINPYNFQAVKMRYVLYSSKWITGAARIRLNIDNWKIVENNGGAITNKLTLSIYNSKRKKVASKSIDVTKTRSVKFIDLKILEKYYVEFVVPNTGNYYSFSGSISTK